MTIEISGSVELIAPVVLSIHGTQPEEQIGMVQVLACGRNSRSVRLGAILDSPHRPPAKSSGHDPQAENEVVPARQAPTRQLVSRQTELIPAGLACRRRNEHEHFHIPGAPAAQWPRQPILTAIRS